jgi:hypothetical protein
MGTMTTARTTGPTGPKTERGKAVASTNAAVHGLLCRKPCLLPGESEDLYREHLIGTLNALLPADAAQADAVTVYNDIAWRIHRWLAVEHHATTSELDRMAAECPLGRNVPATARAADALRAIVEAVGERTELPSPEAMKIFIGGARGVSEILEMVADRPEHEVQDLKHSIDEAERLGEDADKAVSYRAFKVMGEKAVAAREAFIKLAEKQQEELRCLRLLLAKSVLPSDADIRRLGRYLAILQKAAVGQLVILDALREQSKKARRKGTHNKSSFGAGIPTVTLRVVK